MNILDFDHTEHENRIDELQALNDPTMTKEFESHMEVSYTSLMFLGKSILDKKEEGLLDVAIFNIQLLYVYYKRTENYERLAELKKLAETLQSSQGTIVDNNVIDKIHVNLN